MNTQNYSIIGNDFYNRLLEGSGYSVVGQPDDDYFKGFKIFNNKYSVKITFREVYKRCSPQEVVCQVTEHGWSYTFSEDGATFQSYYIDEATGKTHNRKERHYKTYKELLDDCYNLFGWVYYTYGNSDLEQLEIK